MTTPLIGQPLTGKHSRSDLVAEFYERHAAGLFAYCHDQLGETTSAGDAVVAVFAALPFGEPPRAVLYALARREIYRRDVSYAMPAVDSAVDPATALIERVFRDIRPHQREVLLLSAVCGLTKPELSLVLDVAADTAEDLTAGARHRFAQTLATAVSAVRSAPYLASDVAEIYDAIGVAPIEDVLARLPWRRPSADVRGRVLSSLPHQDPGAADAAPPLPIKRLWPTAPSWPLPLSAPDQVSNTCVVPADAVPADAVPAGSAQTHAAQTHAAQTEAPGSARPRRRAKHEATTEPMPRLRGSLLAALGEGRTRRRRGGTAGKTAASHATGTATDTATDTATGTATGTAQATPTRSDAPAPQSSAARSPVFGFPVSGLPVTAASGPVTEPFDAFRPLDPENSPKENSPDRQETRGGHGTTTKDDPPPPVFAAPVSTTSGSTSSGSAPATGEGPTLKETESKTAGESRAPKAAQARSKRVRNRDRHYDWAWELIGFLICLAIALIVFFALPNMVTH
ncbi:RNA polymerase sigma factor [Sphaerimonospora cavernae]|uniref:RNA polymerase sigma factor n=1 Tax=Sphaerimonospora cavernae TaxID=1740611 RepID=A0ABV6U2H4_9ACTN